MQNSLAKLIRDEIVAQGGVIPFVRFMELALYCPNLGYYEIKTDSVGRRGDFFTSVSVGELFGQLLAFQFAGWLENLEIRNSRPKIVEVGAHDGKFAKDILTWLKLNRPSLFEKLEYCIIEPSAVRQQWQRETLAQFNVHWFADLASALRPINGIIFSNELLDAFPVQRFGWDAGQKKWFEWGVTANSEKFEWAKIQSSQADLPAFILNLPSSLLEVLPDNYAVEASPAIEDWWRAAANALNSGKLLTADYGLTDEELLSPSRKNGTLRAFYKHHFADDVLAHPGEQDLTAHVNFSALQKAGEEAGLKTDSFLTQAKFLTQILEKTLKDKTFGEWNPSRTRQFQTLTHPEHLGRAFRVLVQSR